jgi:hypothetical protein
MKLELIRTYYTNGTNGQLLYNGEKVCSTIELPWKENASQISCIPEGQYELRKRYSPKFGWHFLLMDVPGRELILIHPANNALKELKGCIAPVSFLIAAGQGGDSRKALGKLKDLIYPMIERKEKVVLVIESGVGSQKSGER